MFIYLCVHSSIFFLIVMLLTSEECVGSFILGSIQRCEICHEEMNLALNSILSFTFTILLYEPKGTSQYKWVKKSLLKGLLIYAHGWLPGRLLHIIPHTSCISCQLGSQKRAALISLFSFLDVLSVVAKMVRLWILFVCVINNLGFTVNSHRPC